MTGCYIGHAPRVRQHPAPLKKSKQATPKDRHFVTALDRGMQILRCFSLDASELSVSEIARRTKLPQPTVWRLCRTLSKSGFVTRSGSDGKLILGIPVLALGYAVLVRQELARLALPPMQALTRRLRVGTSLAVRDGAEMVYLQRTHGDFVYLNDPVGARRPVATAPTGWACLAAYDEPQRSEVMQALKQREPKAWRNTERNILRALDEYRESGFILSIGVLHQHFNAVAVPIRTVSGGNVYGLSASGLDAEWPRSRLIELGPELISLAKDLSVAPPSSHAGR
jgi:DNA-binding IclR family transcriptional regulator